MKALAGALMVLGACTVAAGIAGSAWAEQVPSWVRDNAGYWADGVLDDRAFTDGVKYLIDNGIITVPEVEAEAGSGDGTIPSWIKGNADLWASGQITDADFMAGIGYLVAIGLIDAGSDPGAKAPQGDSETARLQDQLDACAEIRKALKRLECQDDARQELLVHQYKSSVEPLRVGSVDYYWGGIGSDGNSLEASTGGQAILALRMLAENTSSENVSLSCTSPQICAYDVWDGQNTFKYSGMDFTNGQILLKPGQAKEFNMLFGPNIGYGGTQFLYDPAKDYEFRISEGFGSASIPLRLGQ